MKPYLMFTLPYPLLPPSLIVIIAPTTRRSSHMQSKQVAKDLEGKRQIREVPHQQTGDAPSKTRLSDRPI